MARITTFLAATLVAATALASGSGDFISGGVSVEENESGFEGLRQSVTRNMLNVEAVVGRRPHQQQPDGTSPENIPVSITPPPTALLNNRQVPAPLPNPGGGGRNPPPPNPDTGAASSALASLSAQSSSDVAKASSDGFASGSAVAAASATSQIASISASLAASLSSAIASITATATPAAPGQQPPTTVTVTQTVSSTLIATSMSITKSMDVAQATKSDLLPAPTASNALIMNPAKDPNLVDLTVGQLAAVIIGTIIGTALAAVMLTLLLTRFARRRKNGQVYSNSEPGDAGSQTALRTAYAGEEKGGAPPDEQHPAVRTKSHKSKPSETSQRISVFDERPPPGGETAGFGFGPFNWSKVRNSISRFTSQSSSRPESQHAEVQMAHKRSISSGSKPRLIRLGSRDDGLTPVTKGSQESPAAARVMATKMGGGRATPGHFEFTSNPSSRQVSATPLNLNPPNTPFRNPSGDAVSWGSWGVVVPDPEPDGHMAILLKQPPRHQHNPSSSSGSSKIMDADQLQAAMAADGTVERPPPTRQPSKNERRPSSGTLGVMGGAHPSSRLDGPPNMPHPLPSFAQYDPRQQQPHAGPQQQSYWSPSNTTNSTDLMSPVSSIGALEAFPPPADRRSTHQRVQSMTSSRNSTATAPGDGLGLGLTRTLSNRSMDSSHCRSTSVNSFLLTSDTIHTNGATFSLFPAPHQQEPPPMPTGSYSNASASPAAASRSRAAPRAISAVAPPMPRLSMADLPSPPPLPAGARYSPSPRGSDMV
ncbi:hypothetical protein PG994_002318 [Apiospora phragmitis]|uniref:Uncharacterized protein n=1 Tax=Apiospora phragmitis TaxID=2905665 RepID=A0ABR1WW06_9PEZI